MWGMSNENPDENKGLRGKRAYSTHYTRQDNYMVCGQNIKHTNEKNVALKMKGHLFTVGELL